MHGKVAVRIHGHDLDEAARDVSRVVFEGAKQDVVPTRIVRSGCLLAGEVGPQPRQGVEGRESKAGGAGSGGVAHFATEDDAWRGIGKSQDRQGADEGGGGKEGDCHVGIVVRSDGGNYRKETGFQSVEWIMRPCRAGLELGHGRKVSRRTWGLEAAFRFRTISLMRTKAISLLQELTEAHSVSGHEDEVRAIFVDELEDCGELSADRNGSVFCETGDDGPRVLVAGHMDEVGFMVQNITPDGFIQFLAIGGWWEHNLLSQRVEILTRGGDKMLGVVASRPPHFLPEAQRRQVMSIDQMFIDVGADVAAGRGGEFRHFAGRSDRAGVAVHADAPGGLFHGEGLRQPRGHGRHDPGGADFSAVGAS